jgi:hypothetical protein
MRGPLAIFVVATLAAPSVYAQEPVLTDWGTAPSEPLPPLHPRMALLVGFGAGGDHDPTRFGGGLRVGAHLGDGGFYFGGTVVQHLGSHQEYPTVGGPHEFTDRIGYAALELGREIREGSTVIFPWGGIGVAWLFSKACLAGTCVDRTDAARGLLLSTGVSVYQHFGSMFVGVDGRLVLAWTSRYVSDDEIVGGIGGVAAFALAGWAP